MRLPSIDLLRVLVVVVIVWRHTYPVPWGEFQPLAPTIAIPFFFFLTGWLWRPGSRTYQEEARRRFSSLGVPYLTWLAALYALFIAVSAINGTLTLRGVVGPLLGGSFVGRPFSTFWFFTALFAVAVMLRLLDRASRPLLIGVAVGSLALGAAAGELLAKVPLSLGVALPSIFFAVMGRLLHDAKLGRALVPVAVVTAVASLACLWLPLGWLDLKHGIFGTPLVSPLVAVGAAWSAVVLLDKLFARVPRWSAAIAAPLGVVAQGAILVVLTHPAALYMMASPSIDAPVWMFLVALLAPWAVAVGLQYTPLARLALGQPQRALPNFRQQKV